MKEILLAITAASPTEEALKYSLALAQRLKAKLDVLQVVSPSVAKGWRGVWRGLSKGSRLFEGAMVAAAFAESGEPDTATQLERLISRTVETMRRDAAMSEGAVNIEVTCKVGDPEREIVRFVESRRDVVLAVYDGGVGREAGPPIEHLSPKIMVPTVHIAKRTNEEEIRI